MNRLDDLIDKETLMCFVSRRAALSAAVATLFAAFLLAATPARAQFSAMVAIDPSTAEQGLGALSSELSTSLGKALRSSIRIDRSTNFADVLRSTRTGEYDIYIVPVQVAASGLAHGYSLLAGSDRRETYVLVSKAQIGSVDKLKGARMYLPQQDSIYSYMAKGLLNESGLSLKDLASVQYQKTSGAGLAALEMGVTDSTVTRKIEYEKWAKDKPGKTKVLLESKPVPAGLSVLVKSSLPAPVREKLAQWVATPANGLDNLKPVTDLSGYAYVAGLGNFTPAQLPGVEHVTAEQAAALMAKGTQMVDVRSEKEFNARHIAGAVLVPYLEKSPKDAAFDLLQDDFSASAKLDKTRPTIFSCNGAECWKSYKASKAAAAQGFKTVYWLRGGLPEWDAKGLPVASGR
jgi:rhodanese-related sulfurtransferase